MSTPEEQHPDVLVAYPTGTSGELVAVPADSQDEVSRLVDEVVADHRDRPAPRWQGPPPVGRVVPEWARDRETARAAAAWATRYTAHVTAFHAVRAPVYWGRLAVRAPLGTCRIAFRLAVWATDAESAAMRRALTAHVGDKSYADPANAAMFARIEEQRRELVRTRLTVTAVAALVAALTVTVVLVAAPPPLAALLAASGMAVLGLAGRDPATRIVSRATDSTSAPRLTSDLILTALGALGIGELNKALRATGGGVTAGGIDGVQFVCPTTRDGAGWRAEVDLPPGVTAGDVAERRDRLASGLRRPLSCVWPEGDQDVHTGRLVLWVADKPMHKTKPKPWPLAEQGSVNLFEPFPLGVDPRGREVSTTLMFVSGVVGAQPRMGKTFSLRVAILAAALDPRAELHVYDCKGGADWMPLQKVAHAHRIGDDPDDIAYLLADLRTLADDMTRR